nr:thioredoxin family protein [uncultured Tolumonas sp.]
MTAKTYQETEPSLSEVEAFPGPVVLDFGNEWCGFCQAALPFISTAMAEHAQIPHIKIADGRGKPLGRAFKVKLWPTLIFLSDGKEIARLVRPDNTDAVRDALALIDNATN